MKKLLSLLLAVAMLVSMMSTMAFADEDHTVIYGSTTEISGDFAPSSWFTNNATDNRLRHMMYGYKTVDTDQGGDYVVDATVTKSLETVMNDDGSKTYTITINEGLVYNNGQAITAKDFIWTDVFCATSVATDEIGIGATGYLMIAGGDEFHSGEAQVYSGIRLIDDYTFSVTIKPEDKSGNALLPYFYDLGYAAFMAVPMNDWLPEGVELKDDGEGCYMTGIDAEACKATITASRYNYGSTRITSGAYQLVEYDDAAKQATFVINPNYAGNFEGQKPSIEKIVIVKAEDATWADQIKTKTFNFFDTITDGSSINTALDIIEDPATEDYYTYTQFNRAGYGAVFFQCDFGPTQFKAVRQAVAYLLDRNDFANTFCKGWGAVVSVPAGEGLWQYQDSMEYLDENLNSYPYNPEMAVELLVNDGWVYDAEGNDWTSGLRYKKVTPEEAGTYAANVTLADGTILMPLQLEWSSSEGNTVSELLKVMLGESQAVADAGMVINQNIMTFTELLNYYYRDETAGDQYAVPTYCMFNLANGFSAPYSTAYEFTLDPEIRKAGYNNERISDERLDKLSMDMVYGVEAGDNETHLAMFQELMVRWNDLLPSLPLYCNIYVTMYPSWLEGYTQDSFWNFEQAILYCTVAE